MKKYYYNKINASEKNDLLKRTAINFESTIEIVKPIMNEIKSEGLKAVLKYASKFDDFYGDNLQVTDEEFEFAEKNLNPRVKNSISEAYNNIFKFHEKQKPCGYTVDTRPGVSCAKEYRSIGSVGVYIPGGSAPLPSTMLMLGIPAKIAGCKRIVAVSPSKDEKIHDAILYAAKLCGITEFYKVGGAQAIGLLAYGTNEILKVDKIFGPGNQFVTAAKLLSSIDPLGSAIDMPAGPSEVLIIADEEANPKFVAADLLSQAEHGPDSQVILITNNDTLAVNVEAELKIQLSQLPRKDIAAVALDSSFILIVENFEHAFEFSNKYAPEHLIINLKNSEAYFKKIENAGSVFVGPYSPESAGDYASGTNHSLPTYGYAKSISGVSVDMYMKGITFQTLTKEGIKNIAETVITLAETEKLQAHANAVRVRIQNEC